MGSNECSAAATPRHASARDPPPSSALEVDPQRVIDPYLADRLDRVLWGQRVFREGQRVFCRLQRLFRLVQRLFCGGQPPFFQVQLLFFTLHTDWSSRDAPWQVERFGVTFGFLPTRAQRDRRRLVGHRRAGNDMCFWPPWTSGEYDT